MGHQRHVRVLSKLSKVLQCTSRSPAFPKYDGSELYGFIIAKTTGTKPGKIGCKSTVLHEPCCRVDKPCHHIVGTRHLFDSTLLHCEHDDDSRSTLPILMCLCCVFSYPKATGNDNLIVTLDKIIAVMSGIELDKQWYYTFIVHDKTHHYNVMIFDHSMLTIFSLFVSCHTCGVSGSSISKRQETGRMPSFRRVRGRRRDLRALT